MNYTSPNVFYQDISNPSSHLAKDDSWKNNKKT